MRFDVTVYASSADRAGVAYRDVCEEVIDVVDLQAQQAVTDARMAGDLRRAQRARYLRHVARTGRRDRTFWSGVVGRFSRSRTDRGGSRLRQAV